MKNTTVFSVLSLILVLVPLTVNAQSEDPIHSVLSDRFTVSAGAFIHDKDFDVSADGALPGDIIDFDERWNLSSSETSAAFEFVWRFGEKWGVAGQYFKTSDGGKAVLDEDVHWDDLVFKSGSNIAAGVDLSVARVFFGRKVSKGPRHEFGLGLGLHWLEFGAYLEGEVFVNDRYEGFQRKPVDAAAPLPNIGGWYDYALSPRWLLSARLDWLSADIGDLSGQLLHGAAGVSFQAFRHVGVNLRYQVFQLDLDVDQSDWSGSADLTFKGPFLSLTGNW